MPIHLVVVRPFATYATADTIADTATIAAILASPHVSDVVRVRSTTQEG
jgi:hypothetical protein